MEKKNDNPNKALYKRLVVRGLLALAGITAIIFIVPGIIRVLLPFLIALIVAALLNPLVNKINRKLKVSRKITALILDLLIFLIVFSLIGLLVYTIASEVVSLATNIQQNWDSVIRGLDGIETGFAWLIDLLPPQILDIVEGLEESFSASIQNASKNIVNSVISVTTAMTTKTGNFFVVFIISILAAYFIMADYDRITALAKKYFGKRVGGFFTMIKASVFNALGGYLKSQLLLALFAFVVMFAAFTIYGQPYALLIALFLAFVDLLPIVGTIAVLVPWGIVEFVSGNVNKGLFLLILGVAFFLVRKVVEPKIVGSQTGLHPLAALMSTYVGLQFSGVWGAILGPMVLMLLTSIVKSGIFDSTVTDIKAVAANISKALKQ